MWIEAHIARDDVALDVRDLVAIDAETGVALRPHAAARWAWFDSLSIYTIWSRNRAAGPYDDSEFDWQPEGALLVRPHGDVRWIGINAAVCAFLDACAVATPLAEAFDAARKHDADLDTGTLLARLVEAGALGATGTAAQDRYGPMTMTSIDLPGTAASTGLRGAWNRCADQLSALIGPTLSALAARYAIAGIFFYSGRTKVEGFLTLTPGTFDRSRTSNRFR